MPDGRPGAAILTGSAAGRSVVLLQLRPRCLVCPLESCQGRFDAGKRDPVADFGERCTDRRPGRWTRREGAESRDGRIEGLVGEACGCRGNTAS